MTDADGDPGAAERTTAVTPGAPLALARRARVVAPAREPRPSRRAQLTPEWARLLSIVRATTDEHNRAEAALASARDARQRAILDAVRAGVPRARIGEHAGPDAEHPLSERQVHRLAQAQQPWRD